MLSYFFDHSSQFGVGTVGVITTANTCIINSCFTWQSHTTSHLNNEGEGKYVYHLLLKCAVT